MYRMFEAFCLGQLNILHCKNLLLCPNMWKHPSTPLGFTVWWLALVLWFHLWQFYWVNFHFFFCRNKLLDWCWRRKNKLIKKSCPCVPLCVVPSHLSTWSTCYSVDLSYVTPPIKQSQVAIARVFRYVHIFFKPTQNDFWYLNQECGMKKYETFLLKLGKHYGGPPL